MKTRVILFLIAVVLSIALVGMSCAQPKAPTPSPAAPKPAAPAPAPAAPKPAAPAPSPAPAKPAPKPTTPAAPAPAAQRFVWNMHGIQSPPPQMWADSQEFLWLTKELDTRSNGRLKVEIQWASAMGFKGPDLFRALGDNLVDIADVFSTHLSVEEPWMNIFSFIETKNWDEVKALIDSMRPTIEEYGKRTGTTVLAYHHIFNHGYPAFIMKKLNTLADWKGIKLRGFDKIRANIQDKALGTTTVFIPAGEAIMGMKTGVVDGFSTGTSAGNTYGLDKIAKYAYLIYDEFTPCPNALAVSDKAMAKLPADLQQIVRDVGKEYERRRWDNINNPAKYGYLDLKAQKEVMEKNGLQFLDPPPGTMEAMSKVRAEFFQSWLKENAKYAEVGKTAVAAVEKVRKK